VARELVRIDPQTGARRVLSKFDTLVDPRGVAILPVPEPAGAAGGAVTALALGALRRRAGRRSTAAAA
jgi:hypothetical protein